MATAPSAPLPQLHFLHVLLTPGPGEPLSSPQRAESYYLEHAEHLGEVLHEGEGLGRMKFYSLGCSALSSVQGALLLGLETRILDGGETLNQGEGLGEASWTWEFRVCRT